MPYTTIPPLADGDVLSAAHMNLVADNIEFLKGLANAPNVGFNSYRTTIETLTSAQAVWYIRHRNRYLHYKVSGAVTPSYVRIFYNGVKFASHEAPGSGTGFSGYVDLTTWVNCPNYRGAWVTATGYGWQTQGDGDIVLSAGQYYKCTVDHTSGAGTQPGVGGSWGTVWALLTLPGLLTICSMWVNVDFDIAREVTVEYLIESDGTSL
jgi:hypothetical protein